MQKQLINLFVLIILGSLAACGNSTPHGANSPASIAAQSNYSGPERTLQPYVYGYYGAMAVGSGNIKSNGSFTAELPLTLAAETLNKFGQPSGLAVSDPEARFAELLAINVGTEAQPPGFLAQASTPRMITRRDEVEVGDKRVTRMYFDRDVIVTGQEINLYGGTGTIDASFKAGWNLVVTEVTGVNQDLRWDTHVYLGNEAETSWYYITVLYE